MIQQLIFVILFIALSALFYRNIKRISRNIKLGKDIDRHSNSKERWKVMVRSFRTIKW